MGYCLSGAVGERSLNEEYRSEGVPAEKRMGSVFFVSGSSLSLTVDSSAFLLSSSFFLFFRFNTMTNMMIMSRKRSAPPDIRINKFESVFS